MNYAPTIMDLLCRRENPSEIVLAPGAPALLRDDGALQAVTEDKLTPDDVLETLTTLLGRLPVGTKALERQGSFCFGVPQQGRFHVTYLTQRGMYVMRVAKIPLVVPSLLELLGQEMAERLSGNLRQFRKGLLVLTGSEPELVNRLGYALIGDLNASTARVIHTFESELTFLVKHQKGLVLQAELGSDVPTLEQGVQSSIALGVNIIYVRCADTDRDFEQVMWAIKRGVLVIVGLAKSDVPRLLAKNTAGLAVAQRIGIWSIEADEPAGRARLNFDAWPE